MNGRLGTLLLSLLIVFEAYSIKLCDNACSESSASVCSREDDGSKEEILLLGLFPCNADDYAGRGITVAGQMAVRQINNRTDILENYRLTLLVEDVMCKPLPAVRAFIGSIKPANGLQVRMIIGTGCSSGALVVSPLSNSWNVTMVSFTASDPQLSDKTKFPNFLRAVSSDRATVATVKKLILHYGWKQLGIITDNSEPILTSVRGTFEETFKNLDVIDHYREFSKREEILSSLHSIELTGARVIFVNLFENNARVLLCWAFHQRMYHPEYLWLTYGWYSAGWNNLSNTTIANCSISQEDMDVVLYRSIAINHFPFPNTEECDRNSNVTYTPRQFIVEYRKQISDLGYPPGEALDQGLYVYDAVWLGAFMLNRAINNPTMDGINFTSLGYDNRTLTDRLLSASREINFNGVSGHVEVDEYGDRVGEIRLNQYRRGTSQGSMNNGCTFPSTASRNSLTPQQFARVTEDQMIVFEQGEVESTVWPEGILMDFEENFIDLWLFCLAAVLSGIGVIFAICCIVFDLALHKKQAVKLTSPFLNVVIDIGVILLLINVIFLGLDRGITKVPIGAFCMLTVWLASISFTLIFGTLFAKTFRVYWIWSRSQKMAKAKPLKNWILLCLIGIMCLIDIVFLTIVTAIDSTRLDLEVRLLSRSDGSVPVQVEVCTSTNSTYWVGILLGGKGLFLIVGVFLAVQTWNIKLKQINDSHLIAVSIIAVFVGSVVGGLLAILLQESVDIAFILLGIVCILIGFFLLCLLYLPKMWYMIKHPDGLVSTEEEPTSTTITTSAVNAMSKKSHKLRKEIEETRSKIAKLKQRKNGSGTEKEISVTSSPTNSLKVDTVSSTAL